MTRLKTTEEASGTTGFVRCLHTGQDTSPGAELHRRCLVWQHPILPCLSLFPRLVTRSSVMKSYCSSNEKLQKELYIDWCESLSSLFNLLRARQCPYFYICAHSFTVIYRAAGIAGSSEVHAMIAPTTKGLREKIQKGGVVFTQPLNKKSCASIDSGIGTDLESSQDTRSINIELTDKNIMDGLPDNEEDVNDWMESVKLSQDIFTGVSAQRKRKDRQSRLADMRPDSLVYTEGPEAHALYNFLLNAKDVTLESNGPLAGVPPTLLAPVAFHGATLKRLKVRQNQIQRNGTKLHSLELTGPILPHTPHLLAQLFHGDSHSYSMSMSTLETTAPFANCFASSAVPAAFAEQSLTDCGLHPEIVEAMCSATSSRFVREIVSESGLFKYS